MQKNRLKQIFLAAVILILSFGLCSCGKDKQWKPNKNTIRIEKDKPISQALFFESGIDNNLKNELFTEVKNKIEEYNKKYGKDLVFVINPKEKQSVNKSDFIVLGYASFKEFGRFNDYSVFDGHIYELSDFGFDITNEYFKVENGKVDTTQSMGMDKMDLDGCRVLILDPAIQPHHFQPETEGEKQEHSDSEINYVELVGADIIYVTKNILVADQSIATINVGEKELGYIIYK